MFVYLNGQVVPEEEARVSVWDHGFLYGDGVFEGIRIDDGRIFRLREHVERLYRSAHMLRIRIPLTIEEMEDAIGETARANGMRDGYLRPIVTRGIGALGIEATKDMTDTTVAVIPQARRKFDDRVRFEVGLKAKVLSVRRTPPESLDPRIKCCNYLNHILGKLEQWDSGADSGIMLDIHGRVSEGTAENVFCVRNGVLMTPPPDNTLDGITRQTVLSLAPSVGVEANERALTVYDLYTADEVFASGTLTELVPLTTIDGRQIGTGRPGPVTLRFLEALRQVMRDEAVPVFAEADASW